MIVRRRAGFHSVLANYAKGEVNTIAGTHQCLKANWSHANAEADPDASRRSLIGIMDSVLARHLEELA